MIDVDWLVDDLLRVEDLLVSSAGASSHPLVREPALHLIRAGGKRLRPALVLITSRAGEPGRRATDLASASVELVHLATLYHDDVIDETEVRRGVATVDARWGTDVAVLVGDYLFAVACTLAADAGGSVPGILARAIAEVCEGQVAETATVGDARRSIDEYIATVEMKTAALFSASCRLGVETAGGDQATARILSDYGRALGVTFQIVDDLLDLIGSPEVIGKQPGTDLREGVFTLPVLLACERDPTLIQQLEDGRDLSSILPSLRATQALDEALSYASSRAREARSVLTELESAPWTRTLETILQGVIAQVPVPV